jgi:hypothetical protein
VVVAAEFADRLEVKDPLGAETPAPNRGGLELPLEPPAPPDEWPPPAVSLRAVGTGIAYCLPAGEPGST